jgi:hypothetical protein
MISLPGSSFIACNSRSKPLRTDKQATASPAGDQSTSALQRDAINRLQAFQRAERDVAPAYLQLRQDPQLVVSSSKIATKPA